jgi:hypothetical protein
MFSTRKLRKTFGKRIRCRNSNVLLAVQAANCNRLTCELVASPHMRRGKPMLRWEVR